MEYLCCSCTRLRSRDQVGIWKSGNKNVEKKLLILLCTQSFDGKSYICTTCRPALTRGVPKINMLAIDDFNNVGSIPYTMPEINLMEEYLLKLTIPFIRVSHMPRSPHLKLMGGSVCIQADLTHTMDRLRINPETIIPVSFKRKLAYTGHFIAQVINKNNVFIWFQHLIKYNHLFEHLKFNKSELDSQIDEFEDTLLKELTEFDNKRMSKESLEANELEVSDEFYDSEDEDNVSGEDAKAEILHDLQIHENDTFLYPVNEISLEDKTIPNKIAKLIVYAEKLNNEDFQLQDEFAPDVEHFLFKEEQTNNGDLDDDLIQEMETSFEADDTTKESKKKDKKKKTTKEKKKEGVTVVAPGEGQNFANEFKYQEEKCFPHLFPKGTGGYASTYMSKGLGFSNYCKLR